ncbi:MAG: HNH endonuclease, partial [Acidimicrobiales bacterium]
PTLTQNLAPLCRHDHQVKHTPGWTLTTQPHGYTWTTPHHHPYTTPTDASDGGGGGDGSAGDRGRGNGGGPHDDGG